jgi:hypothetical protein
MHSTPMRLACENVAICFGSSCRRTPTPLHVGPSGRVPAHAPHSEQVQRSIGVAVGTPVEPVAIGLAGGRWDGRDTAQMGERALAPQPVGLSPAVVSNVVAMSVPLRLTPTRSGAAFATSSPTALRAPRSPWSAVHSAPPAT